MPARSAQATTTDDAGLTSTVPATSTVGTVSFPCACRRTSAAPVGDSQMFTSSVGTPARRSLCR